MKLEELEKLYQNGVENKSILPIKTKFKIVKQEKSGFELAVYIREKNLVEKPHLFYEKTLTKKNVFRPYEKGLLIKKLKNHVVIFNKYPVIENHTLLITKKFEPQNNHLTLSDFESLYEYTKDLDYDYFCFFNRGKDAGNK
jgi:sulfate adenylyltransferase (ADP) / ATP adenylyltransferase